MKCCHQDVGMCVCAAYVEPVLDLGIELMVELGY